MASGMNYEYICTHLGEENAANVYHGAVVPPIFETSLHVFESMEAMFSFDANDPNGRFMYGRASNPTAALLEQKLAALEGAEGALSFASGMAAISSAILHCAKPGSHVVTLNNVYGPTRSFLSGYLKDYGIEVTFVEGRSVSDFEAAIKPNTKMFYLESPSSLVMELQDLTAIAKLAKAHGIVTAIDNTWATPINQSPIALGIDIALHTMSKYIGGHSDIIGGALCANSEIISSIRANERELFGGIIGPFEAWLAIRGLRTMPVRVRQSGETALKVAQWLENHPRVRKVNQPFMASHPQHELAKAQMRGGTGLLSFETDASPEQAVAVADALELFRRGVSWGGFESLVCMPMYKSTDEEAASRNGARGLIRIYCGLEDADSLIADLAQALAKLM